jgi:polyisoprenoid-binding protein YceI
MLPVRGGMAVLGVVLGAALIGYSSTGYLLLGGEAAQNGEQHERHDNTHSQSPQSDQNAARDADKAGEAGPSKGVAQWRVLTKRSQLTFKAYQQGSAITGHFGKFSGDIAFNPERPNKGRGKIVINLDTVDTGTTSRDNRLKGETWFYTDQYPRARYVIARFERREGEGNYIARGKLYLRGQSASVDLPFHLVIDRGDQGRKVAHATGQTQLKRLNYGVGQGKWREAETIANRVDVEIDVYAVRQE